MKWLAVDYGDSRTGLAGCDESETVTSPITPQIEEKSMNKVAAAVVEAIKHIDPDREIKIEYGDGLKECRKMLMMAKAGKRDGYLLEGMACPGGCVAGAGTIRPVKESMANVEKFKNAAPEMSCTTSPFLKRLEEVEER